MAHTRDSTPLTSGHSLHYQLTSFIGRDIELVELRRLLRERRLVTLTGAGGSGKTRLAIEAAAMLAQDFPDGVYLADLAPLSRPELVPETVARVLGVEVAPDQPLLDALAGFLCARRTLFVLDNCEHLLDQSAVLAGALLAACPELCVLATSREPLGVGGECTFRVPLLSLPGADPWPGLDDLMGFEAVQLFVDRAQLADPAFALTESNAADVAQICVRLDGIPLALELAAAAVRAIPVSQLAARLGQRFRLLASANRAVLPRHQTLRALLDWSYALLDQHEQTVFRQLAVFPADWKLDAAESICSDGIRPAEVLSVLVQLVNKSVVQLDPGTGRYRMLETVRLYALGKLEEAGEQDSVAGRHFDWCLRFVEEGSSLAGGPGQQQWFSGLEGEQANLRAALGWAIGAGKAGEAARLALDLWRFWLARAYHREARRWLEQILALDARSPMPELQRARLLSALGTLAHVMNEFEQASRYHNEALNIWRGQGDCAGIARVLHDLGWQHFEAMDLRCARQYAEESLALAREAGDPAAVAAALNLFAIASVEGGWLEGLVPVLEESLSIWRSLGVLPEVASALGTLARVEQRLGNLSRAGVLLLESVRLQVSLGDYGGLIPSLVIMVYFEFDMGKPSPEPAPTGAYHPLSYLEHGELLNGPVEATRLLGVMAAWQDQVIGGAPIQWDTMAVPLCEKLKVDMGEAEFAAEFAAGRAMSTGEVVALAEQTVRSVLALPSGSQPAAKGPNALKPDAVARPPSTHTPTNLRGSVSPALLTPREVEVLKLVAAGLTNAQVAERLVITPRTVNAHLTSIYAKTEVTSRAGAVRFAVDHGLA